MNLQKTQWSANGDKLSMTMDFNKVDKENRIVYGFASLDNVDRQGDRITKDANRKAFGGFRGNVREMHENIAAGRVVDYGEETYIDPKDNKSYTGIYVKVRVSKGAPNTWEKVLDGTLSGFSIGGKITSATPTFDKALGENVRIVDEYELVELSLVDNPANQLANIFSVEKSDKGTFVKGMVADTEYENVFWCETDELAKSSSEDKADCNNCGNAMVNIGGGEVINGVNADIATVVNKYLANDETEGGVQKMSDETKNDEVSSAEEVNTDSVVTTDDVKTDDNKVDDNVNHSEDEVREDGVVVEQVNTDTDGADFEKMFDELKSTVTEEVNKGHKATTEVVEKFEGQIEEFKKSQDERFEELKGQVEGFSKVLEGFKSETDAVAKRLAAVEGSTAIKKSGDVEVTSETETSDEGDIFKGLFLPLSGLN